MINNLYGQETESSEMSVLIDSYAQLDSTIRKLLSKDVKADDELTSTFTSWFSTIEKVFNEVLTTTYVFFVCFFCIVCPSSDKFHSILKRYTDVIRQTFESVLAPYNLTDPWSSQILNVTSHWLMDILGKYCSASTLVLWIPIHMCVNQVECQITLPSLHPNLRSSSRTWLS